MRACCLECGAVFHGKRALITLRDHIDTQHTETAPRDGGGDGGEPA